MNKIRLIVNLFLLLMLVAAGCGKESEKAGQPAGLTVDDTIIAQAEMLYEGNCMACHGVELEGTAGPSLLAIGEHRSTKQIAKQILQGSSRMPGFQSRLTEEEIQMLALWLASRKE
ncbi:cytochrome c [Paenibacillus sp. J2TS4]|uniref:c-type cytochrome n=1 Tax=Paenibacillus sp. J2TS4 TaxID=2807194 RepID=UPI001B134360|nr:cytochrome c [Paenibacillus sp. J2TS4]GIP32521.1 hypothetical protein J2TS4_17310 [Paenibacillus sp. J2TS4]